LPKILAEEFYQGTVKLLMELGTTYAELLDKFEEGPFKKIKN